VISFFGSVHRGRIVFVRCPFSLMSNPTKLLYFLMMPVRVGLRHRSAKTEAQERGKKKMVRDVLSMTCFCENSLHSSLRYMMIFVPRVTPSASAMLYVPELRVS
jgi:hypothetical protein